MTILDASIWKRRTPRRPGPRTGGRKVCASRPGGRHAGGYRTHSRLDAEPLEPRLVLNAYSPAMNAGTPVTDWMKTLPDSWTLDQISIPATHDTMCYSGFFWMMDESKKNLNWVPNGVKSVSDTQDLSLREQLDWGIRGIDIRPGELFSWRSGEPDIAIYHGWAALDRPPFDPEGFVLSYIAKTLNEFLTSHPKETVLMRFKPEESLSGKNDQVQATLEHYVRKYPNLFWTGGPANAKGSVVPTLGEARGKVVILCDYESNTDYKWIRYGDNALTFSNGDGSTRPGKAIIDNTYNSGYDNWNLAMDSRWSQALGSLRTAMITSDPERRDWYFTNLNTTLQDSTTQLGLDFSRPDKLFATWTPRRWAVFSPTTAPINQRAFQFFSGITAGRAGLVWLDFPEKFDPGRAEEWSAGDPGLINSIIGLNWPYVTASATSIGNPGGTVQVTARGVDPSAQVSFVAPNSSVYREMQNAVGTGAGTLPLLLLGSPSFPVASSDGKGTYTATYTSALPSSPQTIVPTVVVNGNYSWVRSQAVTVANPGVKLTGGGPLTDLRTTVRVERAGVSTTSPLAVKLQLGGTGKYSGANPDYFIGGVGVTVSGSVVTATIPAGGNGVDVIISPNNVGVAATEIGATYTLSTIADAAYPIDADNSSVSGVIAPRGYMVTTTNASGPGSLQQAMANAAQGSGSAVVTFSDMFSDGTPRTITVNGSLSLGALFGAGFAVKGPGARLLTIKSTNPSQPVFVNPRGYSPKTISGLTISGGRYGIESQGLLDILQCHVTANAYGGIFVYSSGADAHVKVVESTVAGNLGSGGDDQSGRGGSGIVCSANGKITVLNSTVSDNKGVGIERTTTGGQVTIRNATVILNKDSGLRVNGQLYDNDVYNSIVAGNGWSNSDNIAGLGGWNNGNHPSQSGNNVIGTGTGTLAAVVNTTPVIDQGDLTPFYGLAANSPALDRGNNSFAVAAASGATLGNDQRGPGFPRIQGGTVDIGAIEGVSTVAGVRLGGGGVAVKGGTVSFRLHRSGAAAAALTVALEAAGTAAPGTHYSISGGSIAFTGSTATVVFPAGVNDVELTLTNQTDQKNLSANLKLVAGAGYSVPADASLAFAVLNNDGTLVTTTSVGGPGSLSAALAYAQTQSSATVRFAGPAFESGSPAVITLYQQLRVTRGNVTVVGPGANLLTIHYPTVINEAVFLNENASLNLENMTIRGGSVGVQNQDGSGTVRIKRCVVTGGTNGGLINDQVNSRRGAMYVDDTTIHDTGSLSSTGLGVGLGGAIQTRYGTLRVSNSTITNNRAPRGAGVYLGRGDDDSLYIIRNCTVVGNTAAIEGGGFYIQDGSGAFVGLMNSIVAGNVAGSPATPSEFGGDSIWGTNNLIGNAATSGGLANGSNGNIVGVNGTGTRPLASILDATLTSRGGPLPVLEVVPGSPAINAGTNQHATTSTGGALPYDQRGREFLRIRNGIVDIGAVESGVAPTVSSARVQAVLADGAVLEATVSSDGGDAITARGFLVANPQTNPQPTLGSQARRFDVAGSTGVFSATAADLSQGLRPRSAYVVVAFASTRWGTSYSEAVVFTTAGNPTTTTVTSSANVIDFGETATFTARVRNAGGRGTVRFTMGGQDLGAGTYVGVAGDESVWTLTTAPKQLPPPAHEILARFTAAGDSGRADSWGLLEGNFGVRGNVVPTGSFTPRTTTFGTASAASGMTITPAGTGGVVASAPAGFEVSSDAVTWAATVAYPATDDIRTSNLYVRLSAAATAGTYSGNVALSWKTWDGVDKAVSLAVPPSTVARRIIDITVASGSQTDSTAYTGSMRLAKRGAGTLVLSAANTHDGGVVVEEGEVIVRNIAALGTGTLDIRAGAKMTLAVGMSDVQVSRIALAEGAILDLGTSRLEIAAGGADEPTIRRFIVAGRRDGSWDGPGIRSAAAAGAAGARGVGYVIRPDGAATVAFASPGDTDLNGVVDLFDLLAILGSGTYDAGAASVWEQGDFDYNGITDLFDLLAILGAGTYDQGKYLPTGAPVLTMTGSMPADARGATGAVTTADAASEGEPPSGNTAVLTTGQLAFASLVEPQTGTSSKSKKPRPAGL